MSKTHSSQSKNKKNKTVLIYYNSEVKHKFNLYYRAYFTISELEIYV